MKTIKFILAVLALSVIYQFAQAQGNCPGNKIRMAQGSRGCGCNCTKKCVSPADTASYRASGWYFGDCLKFCCFNGWRSLEEEVSSFETALTQIYPNPVSNSVTIGFTLAQPGEVSLELFDVTGRYVTTITHDIYESVNNEETWDAGSVNQGIYFIRMNAGDYTGLKRISVIR